MQEDGDIEEVVPKEMDAVDALDRFIAEECRIEVGHSLFVRKDEFERRYFQFCKDHEVEPPSPGVLGNMLVNCYRMVWGDTVRDEGINTPVWRNIVFRSPQSEGGGP